MFSFAQHRIYTHNVTNREIFQMSKYSADNISIDRTNYQFLTSLLSKIYFGAIL